MGETDAYVRMDEGKALEMEKATETPVAAAEVSAKACEQETIAFHCSNF